MARLLRARFGELSARTQERLARATLAELEGWSERCITAKRVDDAFRRPRRRP